MVTLRELFEDSLLFVPNADESLSVKSLQAGATFKHRGGVYVFFNKHKEPLYVGISKDVAKRVREHLGSPKGNRDLVKYIEAGNHVEIQVIYEPSKMYQEVYESYLIYQLNPRFNVQKTGRVKV